MLLFDFLPQSDVEIVAATKGVTLRSVSNTYGYMSSGVETHNFYVA